MKGFHLGYWALGVALLGQVSCKVKNPQALSQSNLESTDAVDSADSADSALAPLLACRPEYEGATLQSSRFAFYIATAVRGIAGVPAKPGVKVSLLDLRNYYKNQPGHPASGLSWTGYHIILDLGGEGKFSSHGIDSGHCKAVNVNKQTTNSQNKEPIPSLVQIREWEDGYPFADGFASTIMMQGAPLTDLNVSEIARILKPQGWAQIDLAQVDQKQINNLRRTLGCFTDGFNQGPVQDGIYTRVRCQKLLQVITPQVPERVNHEELR